MTTLLAATMTERQLVDNIVDLAHTLGWRVCHFRPALTRSGHWSTPLQGDPGFVDIMLARRGRLILVEAKSEAGRLAPEQVLWLNAITGEDWRLSQTACQDGALTVCVWRPRDWVSGEIERELR